MSILIYKHNYLNIYLNKFLKVNIVFVTNNSEILTTEIPLFSESEDNRFIFINMKIFIIILLISVYICAKL